MEVEVACWSWRPSTLRPLVAGPESKLRHARDRALRWGLGQVAWFVRPSWEREVEVASADGSQRGRGRLRFLSSFGLAHRGLCRHRLLEASARMVVAVSHLDIWRFRLRVCAHHRRRRRWRRVCLYIVFYSGQGISKNLITRSRLVHQKF